MSSEDKAGTKGMIYILIEMDYKLQTQNHKPLVANEGEPVLTGLLRSWRQVYAQPIENV